MRKIVIAVDGTAGSGKTVTFKQVAKVLNYDFIDTGLMYRAFTLLGLWHKIDFNDVNQILNLIPEFDYEIIGDQIFLNKKNITNDLTSREVLQNISKITVVEQVRTMMVEMQRNLIKNNGTIVVGRDITSVVLPNADLKIYLDSTPETRAQRRYEQNLENKITNMSYDQILQGIKDRDYIDSHREIGALKIVSDAWYIDNSNMSMSQTVDLIVNKVRQMERESL